MIDNFGQRISGAELCIGSHYAVSDDKGIAHFGVTEFSIFLKKDVTVWGVGKNDVG